MSGHKFDPNNAARLMRGLRAFFLPQKQVLQVMEVAKNEVWADIGCGPGFFTLPLASAAQKVYALDISEKMIALLRENIVASGVANVEPIISQENIIPLPDSSVDGVLLVFVAHELDNPDVFFREIGRILKDQGRLYVIEFHKQRFTFGPPVEYRISKVQTDSWAAAAGLRPRHTWQWKKSLIGWSYLRLDGWEYTKKVSVLVA